MFWSLTALIPYIYGWGLYSFLLLPLALASIPVLTYVIQRFLPRGPKITAENQHAIEFYTVLNGEEQHGKLTYVKGIPRVMWSIAGPTPRTTDLQLTEATFSLIWNGLRSIGDFEAYKTSAPVESFDLTSNYFVGMAFTDKGVTYMGKFLIPHACQSERIGAWLEHFMLTRHVAA